VPFTPDAKTAQVNQRDRALTIEVSVNRSQESGDAFAIKSISGIYNDIGKALHGTRLLFM
jgi:hypothetical protein